MTDAIKDNIDWIKSGKIGCVFASALAKDPDKIGWKFIFAPLVLEIPKDAFILSIVFKGWDIPSVKEWALENGFYIESVHDMYDGLRIKQGKFVSWVQYFGPDSHVKTRQSPHPMLSFCCKLPSKYYFKVGFQGILHLAHASVEFVSKKAQDTLWSQSISKTKKELGFSPTIKEAAKTTYEKNINNRSGSSGC